MKSIKNSLKKLSHRLSGESSAHHLDFEANNNPREGLSELEVKRSLYHEGLPKVMQYKSYQFPEDVINVRVLESLDDFELRHDDIFLLSYPATSSHLLEDLVQSLLGKVSEKNSSPPQTTTSAKIQIARLEVSNPYGHIRWLKSLKSPRVFASNLPFDLMPAQLRISPSCKIIYLVRNPKDHIIAYYYQHRFKGVQLSLDDFIELYLTGYLLYGNYFEHVLSFWQLAQLWPDNVMFVTYEELKMIPLDIAKLISEFLHLNLTINEINQVVVEKHPLLANNANNVVTAATKTEADPLLANAEKSEAAADDITGRKTSLRIHKYHGVLGDWVNYFTPEQARRLDDTIRTRFESQRLVLTCDASTAVKRIQKYGRILDVHPDKDKGGSMMTRTQMLQRLITGQELEHGPAVFGNRLTAKPVLTKDEAVFIRRKDKVVILEDHHHHHQARSAAALHQSAGVLRRLWWWVSSCCCWCCVWSSQHDVPEARYEPLK